MITVQQQLCIDTIQKKDTKLMLIEAIAGSGKTFLLKQITLALKTKNGLYLAYNKSIARRISKRISNISNVLNYT